MMNTVDPNSHEDDMRDVRDTARDREMERSLRSLLRAESPDPAMQQRIKDQLEKEWLQLQRRRSDQSLSLG
jgi:hypothetical protein